MKKVIILIVLGLGVWGAITLLNRIPVVKNEAQKKAVHEQQFDKKLSMKTIDSLTASYNYKFSHENLTEDIGKMESLTPEQVYAAVLQNEGTLK